MAKVVAHVCPRCGAPVSAGHTLLTCEFCGSELMMMKTNVAPPMPATDFASAGAHPAPPHVHVEMPSGRGGAPVILILGMVSVLAIGALTAVLMLVRSSDPPPPQLPPGVTTSFTIANPGATEPPPAAAGTTDPAAMVGMVGFLDARCNAKDAHSCVAAGMMYQQGQQGLPVDKEKAKAYFAKACAMGDTSGCTMQKQVK